MGLVRELWFIYLLWICIYATCVSGGELYDGVIMWNFTQDAVGQRLCTGSAALFMIVFG